VWQPQSEMLFDIGVNDTDAQSYGQHAVMCYYYWFTKYLMT